MDVSAGGDMAIDIEKLEGELKIDSRVCVVVISCGEVNTGGYATESEDEARKVRDLCDRYGAWLHVDGGEYPFRVLYVSLISYIQHLESLLAPYQAQIPSFSALLAEQIISRLQTQ